ncbi:aromatic prenyltransferase [Streptomyces sp. NPDC029554]|uniref:aromatic prenyltransferase n=1 Tax=Streptomyces sp. NPDC029554 TaxID=3155126 RepID=UPI0033EAC160
MGGTIAFSEKRFLGDMATVAGALGSELDLEVTRTAVRSFASSFHTGGVQFRATSRPGDRLNYRFYPRERIRSTRIALRDRLIEPSPLTELLDEWSSAFADESVELCDFDPVEGLSKTWLFMGRLRPVDEVLAASRHIPEGLRELLPVFEECGLVDVRYAAVDYAKQSLSIYFRVAGPLTPRLCSRLHSAVGLPGPSPEKIAVIVRYLRENFVFAVNFSHPLGRAVRTCIYAVGIPDSVTDHLSQRLATFLDATPCYDREVHRVVGWSSGSGDSMYQKAEKSYCGDLSGLLESWNA